MNDKDFNRGSVSQSGEEQVSSRASENGTVQIGEYLSIPADKVLLTVDEVAAILRVPRSWVYSHQDQLPTVRLGRYVRFRRSEIELFLGRQKAC